MQLVVDLADRSYPIEIGSGVLLKFGDAFRSVLPGAVHAVVMFDENVHKHVQQVESQLKEVGIRCTLIAIPSGENSKSIAQLEKLWGQMLEESTDRASVVVAVGGGVVGDLAGFAAASFARGLPFVQVPTTLLAQVDSSVGGKTGINLPNAKNMVGAFWQPKLVAIDADTLKSLPERDYISGLAEVAKYGVIVDSELFDYLEGNAEAVVAKDEQAATHIVTQSCAAKAAVVKADERETSGVRAILNYGHTFAHAIEKVAGYGEYLHGEAVSIGMCMAAELACRLGKVDRDFVERQKALLEKLKLPVTYKGSDFEAHWQAMQSDKKVEAGKLRFILPNRIGSVELVAGVSRDEALAAFAAVCS